MAEKRGRRFQTEASREKIKTSQIINRLSEHVEGKVDMKPTQVKAAQILLDRVLPTLSMADVMNHQGEELTLTQKWDRLVQAIGETRSKEIYPDAYAKVQAKRAQPAATNQ